MKDLIRLVEYFIYENDLPKNIDCVYGGPSHSLLDIANIINNLSDHKVEIKVNGEKGKKYIGDWNPLNIKWKGLKPGIKETYKKLLNETN